MHRAADFGIGGIQRAPLPDFQTVLAEVLKPAFVKSLKLGRGNTITPEQLFRSIWG